MDSVMEYARHCVFRLSIWSMHKLAKSLNVKRNESPQKILQTNHAKNTYNVPSRRLKVFHGKVIQKEAFENNLLMTCIEKLVVHV